MGGRREGGEGGKEERKGREGRKKEKVFKKEKKKENQNFRLRIRGGFQVQFNGAIGRGINREVSARNSLIACFWNGNATFEQQSISFFLFILSKIFPQNTIEYHSIA